ncbi:stage II sporulation protein D [Hydrogenispora ethanolica]|jgi:stage II sporulation protein D|uniref:Stage II sporulation protein D n=1 Tax=Hydrogenispora ethanolica TaxID=1082276 RepID=A0A4R1RGV8_HYDET|nr:SpoIID/LytB domain-containing protein [Hydrogenispora ethanolica]TCL65288.1 stage II sporulation protein D [Hydrogenispora ethanolica]
MRKIDWRIWIVILGLLAVPARCSAETLVRIGIGQNLAEVKLAQNAGAQLLDLSSGVPQPLSQLGEETLITAGKDAILVDGNPIGAGPLEIAPGTGLLTWNRRLYRGVFSIALANGKLTLVNQLPLEDYLRGVVPREVIPSWPLAALKAQAIAARTYTVASLGKHAAAGFDLCDTTHCQAYGGASYENPNTDRAVAETAGAILSYGGKAISAFFHVSSGNYTSDSADIWGGTVPYLKEVPDWDSSAAYAQWTRSFQWSELQALVARSYPKIGALQQILPVAFGRDSRVMKLLLKGALEETTVTGEQFRNLAGLRSSNMRMAVVYGPEPCVTLWWVHGTLYPEALVATTETPGLVGDLLNPPWDLFDPWEWLRDKEPVQVVFKGAGWGHGVGLSQAGAKTMAERGYNERQILEYFYPGAKVTDLPDPG